MPPPVKEKRPVSGNVASSGMASGAPASAPKSVAKSPFALYKPGQGTYVRWGTAVGAGVLVAGGSSFLFNELYVFEDTVWRFIIPVAVMVAMACVVFWLVGRYRSTVDFMIATEGEMKKVNWSTRREVIGATKVVIATTLGMGALLFVADMICIFVLSGIRVIRIDLFSKMFGGSG